MGEQVKLLRKENQDLKKQLSEIQTNLISIQKEVNYEKQHGAGKKQRTWSHTPSLTITQPDTTPNENGFQFFSNEYDELLKRLTNLEAHVSEIARKSESISKAIDDIQLYSYQYNLKIVGVPQTDPDEKASRQDFRITPYIYYAYSSLFSLKGLSHDLSMRSKVTYSILDLAFS